MLNKILIKMIMNQLLKDTFMLTFIEHTYAIEHKGMYFEITINATLNEGTVLINKYKKIRVENWVELITEYKELKNDLEYVLIENIGKGDK